MPATALKLAAEEPLVDINHASARELESVLPGIGEVLARRIVEYRDAHGPFEDPSDLSRVPGISDKRLSKAAPRISLAPVPSGFRIAPVFPMSEGGPGPASTRPSPESSRAAVGADERRPLAVIAPGRPAEDTDDAASRQFFAEVGPDALREPIAPSLDSLLPADSPENLEVDHNGGSLPGAALGRAVESPPQPSGEVASEESYALPVHRPLRLWLVLASIGLFSALFGTALGLRSQGSKAVERRVDRVQVDVADVAGAVKGIEKQTGALASSIDTLDRRITAQEQQSAAGRPKRVDPRAMAIGQTVRRAVDELESVAGKK